MFMTKYHKWNQKIYKLCNISYSDEADFSNADLSAKKKDNHLIKLNWYGFHKIWNMYITKMTTYKFISTFEKETQKFIISVSSEITESFTLNTEKPLEQLYLLNV